VIDFVQIFEICNRIIEILGRKFSIENSIGIVENHYAKWGGKKINAIVFLLQIFINHKRLHAEMTFVVCLFA
jgi:hypothetical protein